MVRAMRARPFRIAAAALAAGLLLVACGDDDDGGGGHDDRPGGAADADVIVVAEDPPGFDRDTFSAPAGTLTIAYENGGSILHTLVIDGVDDFKLEVGEGDDVDTGSVELEAGEYEIYCDVSGHRAAGMEATLTVE